MRTVDGSASGGRVCTGDRVNRWPGTWWTPVWGCSLLRGRCRERVATVNRRDSLMAEEHIHHAVLRRGSERHRESCERFADVILMPSELHTAATLNLSHQIGRVINDRR